VQNNPFVGIPIAGDHIHYQDLQVTFKIDEDLQNWFEIHNWIRSLGFPDNFTEYAKIADAQAAAPTSGLGIRSDISLIILNAVKTPIYDVVFREAFPTYLSDMTFTTTDTSVNYITATATFRYILYDVNRI
jgi:hypothetical protein